MGAPGTVVDPVQPVETQTEAPPPPEVDEGAAAPPAEAAPTEPPAPVEPAPSTEPPADEPRYVTEDRLEEIRREAERSAAERLRAEKQRQDALRRRAEESDARARADAVTKARLAFIDHGVDAPIESIQPAFESYVNERRSAYERAVEADSQDAFVMAAAEILGVATPSDLTPSDRAHEYAQGLKPYVQGMYEQAERAARAKLEKEYVARADVPKLIDAAVKAKLAGTRVDPEFKAPNGTAAGPDVLTPERYAAMSAVEMRQLQREKPELINAMLRQQAAQR